MRSVFESQLHPEPSAGILTLQCMAEQGDMKMMSSGRDGVIKLWTLDEARGGDAISLIKIKGQSRVETGAYSFCRPLALTPSLVFHASTKAGCVDMRDVRCSSNQASLTLTLTLSSDKEVIGAQGGMCMALSLPSSPNGSSDGQCRVLAGFEDGSVALWDLRQPSSATQHSPAGLIYPLGVRRGHCEPLMCLDTTQPNALESSRGGKPMEGGEGEEAAAAEDRLASSSSRDDKDDFDSASTEQVAADKMRATDSHAYGQLVASGSADDKICIWSLSRDGPLIKKKEAFLTQSDPGIAHLAWSSDGRVLASAGWDGKVRLWSPKAKQLAILRYHQSQSTCVKFLHQPAAMRMEQANNDKPLILTRGQILASSSRDGTIALWSV